MCVTVVTEKRCTPNQPRWFLCRNELRRFLFLWGAKSKFHGVPSPRHVRRSTASNPANLRFLKQKQHLAASTSSPPAVNPDETVCLVSESTHKLASVLKSCTGAVKLWLVPGNACSNIACNFRMGSAALNGIHDSKHGMRFFKARVCGFKAPACVESPSQLFTITLNCCYASRASSL